MFVQHGSDRNSPGLTARYFQKLRSPLSVVLNGGFPLAFHLWMGKKFMLPNAVFFMEQTTTDKIPNQAIINVMFRSNNPVCLTLNQVVFYVLIWMAQLLIPALSSLLSNVTELRVWVTNTFVFPHPPRAEFLSPQSSNRSPDSHTCLPSRTGTVLRNRKPRVSGLPGNSF